MNKSAGNSIQLFVVICGPIVFLLYFLSLFSTFEIPENVTPNNAQSLCWPVLESFQDAELVCPFDNPEGQMTSQGQAQLH